MANARTMKRMIDELNEEIAEHEGIPEGVEYTPAIGFYRGENEGTEIVIDIQSRWHFSGSGLQSIYSDGETRSEAVGYVIEELSYGIVKCDEDNCESCRDRDLLRVSRRSREEDEMLRFKDTEEYHHHDKWWKQLQCKKRIEAGLVS